MQISLAKIIEVLGGATVVAPSQAERVVEQIVWDSRAVTDGCAFLAIKGERVDGNSFIGQALSAGAALAIACDEPGEAACEKARLLGAGIVRVEDPCDALRALAGYVRSTLTATVVGISGSSGKTTTKNMIAHVLSAEFATVATKANQNNELGVPATVLNASEATEALVVEMGMRGFGQLESLCEFVRPGIGVLTNIGTAHAELLGSQENIARAKAELIAALPAGGTAVLNGDDPFTPFVREVAGCDERGVDVLLYGTGEECSVRATDIEFSRIGRPTFSITFPNGRSTRVELPLMGMHNVLNALAAAAVGYACDMPIERIANALRTVEGQSMRQELVEAGDGVIVINDAYNANPDSMRAALSLLSMMDAGAGRKIAVLGDMGELGADEVADHRGVGEAAAACGPDLLVTIGELGAHIAAGAVDAGMPADHVVACADVPQAVRAIEGARVPDSIILVKASRFMELERVVEELIG
ncbi:MAG: UDP-N-acetylmuramoyl-tripeptide--D-alanyl-D-alanine ligase [Coriobacteriales bacterium]